MVTIMKRTGAAIGGAVTAFALPLVTFAQNNANLGTFTSLAKSLGGLVNILIGVAFTLIVLAFFWGLAKYVANADDQEARDQGKNIMIGGVIALFIASSIWGIISILQSEFGINDDNEGEVPGVNTNFTN